MSRPFYTYLNTFHQQKCLVFVIICNYPGGLHVAAATWLCTYLFMYIVHICYSHINVHCTVWRYDAYPISSIYQCASCQKIAGGQHGQKPKGR